MQVKEWKYDHECILVDNIRLNTKIIGGVTKVYEHGGQIYVLNINVDLYTLEVYRFYDDFDSSITIRTRLYGHKTPQQLIKLLDTKICS